LISISKFINQLDECATPTTTAATNACVPCGVNFQVHKCKNWNLDIYKAAAVVVAIAIAVVIVVVVNGSAGSHAQPVEHSCIRTASVLLLTPATDATLPPLHGAAYDFLLYRHQNQVQIYKVALVCDAICKANSFCVHSCSCFCQSRKYLCNIKPPTTATTTLSIHNSNKCNQHITNSNFVTWNQSKCNWDRN